jgi:hypothetical protein
LAIETGDVNLLQESKNTKNKAILDAGKEISLEVNPEITKYMFMSHHQNIGQNHNTKIANRSLKM